MRRQRGRFWVMGLAALGVVGMGSAPADARVTTEESASILVFPKVISDGIHNTIIQITNTSNNVRHAHCFYVNAAPTDPGAAISDNNPPLWSEVDFDIWLTKQQPTHWVVSTGRQMYPFDATCVNVTCDPNTTGLPIGPGDPSADCCDAGLDPGRVPPVAPDFTGELICIEVDASGFPVPGNALKGEATIQNVASGDVSKYNAVGLKGFDTNNMDGTLCLGGGVDGTCPTGAEYEACPQQWFIEHAADGAPNPVVDNQATCVAPPCSSVSATLTVVPCTQDFEARQPDDVTLQFIVTNEFEQSLSASATFTCWANYSLNGDAASAAQPYGGISPVFEAGTVGGDVLKTTMRAVGNQQGVIPVIEETHTNIAIPAIAPARSAQNVHSSFEDVAGPDIVTIPGDQLLTP